MLKAKAAAEPALKRATEGSKILLPQLEGALASLPEQERHAFTRSAIKHGVTHQVSLHNSVREYGRWLRWLDANKLPRNPNEHSLRRYAEALKKRRCQDISIATMLKRILTACKLIFPEQDWRWLHQYCSTLWNVAKYPRKSRALPGYQRPPLQRIPFEKWPEEKRQKWLEATAPRRRLRRERFGCNAQKNCSSLGNGKRPDQWTVDTRDTIILAYGRLLAFQRKYNLSEDVTPECISRWVNDMDARHLATWTSAGRVKSVFAAMSKVFEPERDWTWLQRDVRLLRSDVKAKRDKSQRLVKIGFAWAAAVELMKRAEQRPHHVPSASIYQAGLMMGFLLFHPPRIKNLAEMEVGVHLIFDLDENPIRMRFRTKVGLREFDFAPELLPFWRRYWDWFRTLLPGAEGSDSVWPNGTGRPITPRAARRHISRATATTFLKTSLNPHIFRDIVATALTEEGVPEAAKDLLGQTSLRALAPYIEFADSKVAAQHVRRILELYRSSLLTVDNLKI